MIKNSTFINLKEAVVRQLYFVVSILKGIFNRETIQAKSRSLLKAKSASKFLSIWIEISKFSRDRILFYLNVIKNQIYKFSNIMKQFFPNTGKSLFSFQLDVSKSFYSFTIIIVMFLSFVANSKAVAATVDLKVNQTVSSTSPAVGGIVKYTVTLTNAGPQTATNIVVEDIVPLAGLSSVSGAVTGGTWSYNGSSGIGTWTVPTLAANQSLTLEVSGTATGSGVYYNVASVKSNPDTDINSTPGNYALSENDIASSCFTVPYTLATGDKYKISIPAPYSAGSGFVWYKDGTAVTAANSATLGTTLNADGSLTFSQAGNYTFSSVINGCNASGCCAVVAVSNPTFDLGLKKSTVSTTLKPGDLVTFNLVVTNYGNTNATNVQITDNIPSGLILNDANWTQTGTTAKLNNLIASIPAGQTGTVSITFKVDPNYPATSTPSTILNYAVISGSQNPKNLVDTNPSNDSSTAPVNVVNNNVYDLALRKTTTSTGPFYPGSTVTFNVEVFNQGNVLATGIKVTDYIPTGLTLSDPNWTASGSTALYNNTLVVSPGQSAKIPVTFKVNSNFTGTTLTNNAEISDCKGPNGETVTDIDSNFDSIFGNDVTINDIIDQNGKTGGDEDDEDLEQITISQLAALGDYVWNDANQNGIQDNGEVGIPNVVVTLQKPDGTFVASTTTDANGKYLFPNLIPGDYVVVFNKPAGYTATSQNSGSNTGSDSNANTVTGKTSTITLAAGETNLSIDAGYYLVVCPYIQSALTATPNICPGSTATLTATTSNGAAVNWYTTSTGGTPILSSNSGVGVSVSPASAITYYAQVTGLSASCPDIRYPVTISVYPTPTTPSVTSPLSICSNATPLTANLNNAIVGGISTIGGVFEWHVSNSPSSAMVSSPTAVSTGTYYLFEKSTYGCYSQPAMVTVTVKNCDKTIDVGLVKTASKTTANQGDLITYTVAVTNYGPDVATNVKTQDVLPAGLVFVSSSNVTNNNGVLNASIATLAVGQTVYLTYIAQATVSGTLTNVVNVSSVDQKDTNPNNDKSQATVIVVPKQGSVDLSLLKTVSNTTPKVNDIITYTITVTNAGPDAATNVIAQDNTPNGLQLISATGSDAITTSGNNVTAKFNTIVAGASGTFTVTAKVLSTGTMVNYAEVMSQDQKDIDSTPGDGSTTQDDDDQKTIIVQDQCNATAPVASVSPVSAICPGVAATLMATGCSNGTVTWSNGQVGASVSVSPTVTTTYTAYCTMTVGTTTCISPVSNTVTVSVTQLVAPAIQANTISVCAGSPVVLTATGCTNGVYYWSNGITGTPVTVYPTQTLTSYTAYCIMNGCTSGNSLPVSINVIPIPPTPIISGGSTICAGTSAVLSVSNCTGNVTWSNSMGGSTITVSPTSTTSYTAICTAATCVSPSSTPATIVVTPKPTPVLVALPSTICAGAAVSLNVTGCDNTNINWGSLSGSGNTITVYPTVNTTYSVTCGSGTCSGTANVSVTVSPKQSPVMSPISATICAGESTTLSVMGCTGTVVWTNSSSNATSITVSPIVTTTYSATCGTGTCAATVNATVTVNQKPTPTLTASPNTICLGDPVTLTVSGCGNYPITWTGVSNNTSSTAVVYPTTNSIYSITCGTGTCIGSAQTNVTVSPKQTPTISPANTTICAGESNTLNVSGCVGNVVWSNNSSTTSSITVSPTVTTTYTVTCGSGNCAATGSATVTVNQRPTVTLTATPNPVCSGDAVTLTASGCGSNAITWTGVSSNSSTVVVNPTSSTSYSVTCGSGNCTGTASVSVTVSPKQYPVVSPQNATICAGDNTTLTVTGCTSNVVWSYNGSTSSSITVSPTATITYTVTCGSGNCAATASATVTVNQRPSVTLTATPNPVCAGDAVTLTASGCGSNAITWTGVSSNSSTVVVNPTSSTSYSVTCGSGNCTGTASVSVTVSPKQYPVVSPQNPTICASDNTTLTVTGCTSNVVWSYNGSTSSSITVSPAATTTYTVTCGSGNCAATGSATVTVNQRPTVTLTATPNPVCAGDAVTLFASGCGSNAISWTGVSSSSSTVVVYPTSSTNYSVMCGTGNCTGTASVSVTVSPKQYPVVSPQNSTICAGDNTTLTVTGCTSNVVWSYNGSTSSSITVSPAATTTYTVTCGSGNCAATGSATVTINQRPTVTLTATPNPVCAGDAVTLTASGCGSNAISWTGVSSSSSTVVVNPTSSTSYSVMCGSGNCTGTASVSVTVSPKQYPTVSPQNPTICAGDNTTLTVTGCTSNVVWSYNGSTSSSITVSPAATTTYTVTCGSGNCAATGSATVTVNQRPTVSLTATPNPVCAGDAVTLTASGCGSNAISWTGVSSSSSSVVVYPTSSTSYSVMCGSGNCTGTSSVSVTVNTKTTPTISASATTICSGESVNLTGLGCSSNSYIWSTGALTQSITMSPVSTTVYTLTCGGTNTCSTPSSVTINVSAKENPVINGVPTSMCAGETVTLNVTGCSVSSIKWSNGSTSTSITVSPTSTTVYGVTCGSGTCQGAAQATVNVTPKPTPSITASSNTICAGDVVTLNVTGCSGNITWSNGLGSTSQVTATPSVSTTYSVTCGNGTCTGTQSTQITVNPKQTISISTTNPNICQGESTTLTVYGCTSAIKWSDNSTGNSISVTPSSTTMYSVTCGTGTCVTTQSATVTVTTRPTPATTASANAVCAGDPVTLTVSGCSSSAIAWSNGLGSAASVIAYPTVNTTYIVTCGSGTCMGTSSITINTTPKQTVVASPSNSSICVGASTTLTATGCTSSLLWSTGSSASSISVSPTSTTTYTVSCGTGNCIATSSATVTVNQKENPVVNPASICSGNSITITASGCSTGYTWSNSMTGSSITVSPTSTTNYNVSCQGNCSGTATVTVNVEAKPSITFNSTTICAGETATLIVSGCSSSVAWSNNMSGSQIQVSPTSTTTYTATCGTGNCTGQASGTVTVNPKQTPSITPSNSTICSGESVTLTASNCSSTYNWSTGSNAMSITVNPTSTMTYTVTCGTGNCAGTASATVNVNAKQTPSITPSNSTICSGESVTLTASNCSSTYNWSTGSNASSITVNPTSTMTYTVTCGTGACAGSASATVNVNAKQSPSITPSTSTICSGESVTLTASNCSSTYNWSTGSNASSITVNPTSTMTYTVTCGIGNCAGSASATVNVNAKQSPSITPSNSTICSGESVTLTASNCSSTYNWSTNATSQSITVNPTSTMTYTVTCGTGNCAGSASATVNVNAKQSPSITPSNNTICSGESVTLTASNCSSTYNWSTNATSQSITVNPTSTMTYTVTCGTGNCAGSASATVNVNAKQSPSITPSNSTICSGESVTLTANNCSSTYNWSTNATSQSITVNPTSTMTYTVTCGTGACAGSASATVNVNAKQSPTITASATTVCSGETVTLSVNNCTGTPTWSTGAMTTSITVNPTQSTPYSVSCGSGACIGTATVSITVSPKQTPSITPSNSTICSGESVTLTASNCSSTYIWSTNATSQSITVNPTSTMTYTVTCGTGACAGSASATVNVNAKQSPTITASATTVCSGETVTLSVNNCTGTPTWSTGAMTTSITVNPTQSTPYSVSCGSGACIGTATVSITVSPKQTPSITPTNSTICSGESVTLTASNCSSTYIWSTNATSQSITVNPTSTMTYTVTCGTGACAGSASATVNVNAKQSPTITASATTVCSGETVTLSVNNCTSTPTWSTVANTTSIIVNPSQSTSYSVSCGSGACIGTATVSITVSPKQTPSITPSNSTICSGETVTLTASNCNSTYNWSTNATSQSITVNPTSTMTYTVTCGTGNCAGSASATVNVNAKQSPTITASATTVCSGETVTLSVNNCTGTPTWSTGAMTTSITVNPTQSTPYSVSCGSGACIGTATVSITVSSKTTPTIVASSDNVCPGTAVILTASGCTSYSWSTSQNTAIITVLPQATTTYTVSCGTGACAGTASKIITVTPLTNIVLSATKMTLCAGESTTITAAACVSTVTWSNGMTGNSIIVTPTATTKYTATCGSSVTCQTANDITITVNSSQSPVITSTPNSVCAGESATLTVAGCTSPVWSTNATTSSITVNPTVTTTYTVTCGTGSCSGSASAKVTVNAKQSPTITASATTVCSGESVTLTANNCTTTPVWSTGTTANQIVVNPTQSTSYSVSCGSGACIGTATVSINVTQKSTPTLSATNLTVCSGGSSTITAANCSSTTSQWSNGVQNTNTITVMPTATTTYTFTCGSGTCAGTASITINVSTSQTPVVTASPITICAGESSTLTATNCTSGLVWSTGATTSTITVTPSSTTNYTVVCGSGTCAMSSSVTVTVATKQTPSITASNNSICLGESATLTASNCTAGYTWSTGATTASITVNPTSTTTYTVTCGTGSCAGTASSTINVNTKQSPTITASSTTVCSGESITLSVNNCTNPSWSTVATTSSITVSPTQSTSYSVSCGSGACIGTATVNIIVSPKLTPSITASNNSICSGETVTLTATNCTSTMLWSTGATTSAITVNPTSTTTYTVTCGTGNCAGTASSTINVGTKLTPIITPTATSICAGDAVSMTVSNCSSSILWSTGATTSTINVSPTANTTYTATCGTGACQGSASQVITINTKLSPTITANNSSICAGQTVILTAGNCASTMKWSNGQTTSTISVTPTITTTYTLTCGTGNCSGTASTTVNVGTAITPVITPANPTICAGSSTTLTVTGCSSTILWSSGATTSAITVTPSTTTNYNVTCGTSTCSGSASTTVTVSTILTPVISASNMSVCAGDAVTLTASNCSSNQVWSTGQTGVSSIMVNPTANTTYKVTCGIGTCTGNASIAIAVTSKQTPTVTISNANICAGESVSLTANNCSGTILWSTGQSASSIMVSPNTTTTYTVSCGTGTCMGTSTAAVTVTSKLSPTIVASPTSICSGQSSTLTVSNCGTAIAWSTGQTTNTITVMPTATTSYTVTCGTGACIGTATISVTVNTGTNPTITSTAQTVCAGQSVTLTATGCSSSMLWNTGATTSSITVTPTVTASYNVTCGGTSTCSGSASATITVTNPSAITISATKTTICSGEATSLTVNGCNSTYTWSNGGTAQMITVSPTTNTTYTVTCGTGSCTSTATQLITVNTGVTPNITATNATVCSGGSSTLTASNCTSNVLWNTNATTASITVNPTVTTTYSVVCGTGACAKSSSVTITVTSGQNPTINVTRQTICNGASTTLTANGCTSNIQWNTGDNTKSITVSPNKNSTYVVNCQIGSCTGTASTEIIIADFSTPISLSATKMSICGGESTTISANNCTGGSVTWNTGDTGQTLTVSPLRNSTYTANCKIGECYAGGSIEIVVNNGLKPIIEADRMELCPGQGTCLRVSGCTSDIMWSKNKSDTQICVSPSTTQTYRVVCKINGCLADNTITITVINPDSYTVTASNDKICKGQSTTLTLNNCSYEVLWSTGASTQSITVSPSSTTSYSVQCGLNTCHRTITHDITVSDPASLTITSDKASICSGETANLTLAGCNGTIAWNSGQTSATIAVMPTQTTTYSVTCNGSCSSNATYQVVVNASSGSPIITSTATTVCSGQSATLTAVGCSTAYAWSNGTSGSTITVSPTQTTVYTVTCGSGSCQTSSTFTLNVNSNTVAPVITASATKLCNSESVTLTATGCSGTVVWSNGNIGSTITVSPTVSTTYTAKCTIPGMTCDSPNSNQIIFTPATGTVPTAPVVTCNNCRICAGQSTTITASGCTGGTIMWHSGTTSVAGTTSYTVTPTVTTAYYTTCIINGCESDASNAATITLANPIAPVVSCNGPVICLGSTATIVADGCSATNNIVKWSNGMTGTSITVSPTVMTTYSAVCVNGTCTSEVSNSVTVIVHGNTLVTPTVTSLATVCPKTTVDLSTAIVSAASAGSTYVFRMGNTVGSLAVANAAAVGTAGNYYVFESGANGCYSPGAAIAVTISNCGTNGGTTTVNPSIAVALSIKDTTKVASTNSYNVTYRVIVKNTGDVGLTNVALTDSLGKLFTLPTTFTIVGAPYKNASSQLVVNPGFNGSSNVLLTTLASTLAVGKQDTICFTVNVVPNKTTATISNQIFAAGTTTTNGITQTVTDWSNAGTIPNAPDNSPTSFITNNGGSTGGITDTTTNYIGLAKQLVGITANTANAKLWDVEFLFIIKNFSNVALTTVKLVDDLTATFGSKVVVKSAVVKNAGTGLVANTAYTGTGSNTSILTDASTIAANSTQTVTMVATLDMSTADTAKFVNSALVSGMNGTTVLDDVSQSGIVSDSDNDGNPKNNSTPTAIDFTGKVVVTNNITKLGIAKAIADTTVLTGGAYQIRYKVVVKNYDTVALTNVTVTDSLSKVFSDSTTFKVTVAPSNLSVSNGLVVNPDFNGTTDNNLILTTSTLAVGETDTLTFTVKVVNKAKTSRTYRNSIFGTALSGTTKMTDVSVAGLNPDVNGDGNPGNDTKTTDITMAPATSTDSTITVMISGLITPNGDGKNDVLVIKDANDTNTSTITSFSESDNIKVMIYNRWGQLVYQSDNYVADVNSDKAWKGTANKGIRVDNDSYVPDGTYYYTVSSTNEMLFGGKSVVNFITIKR